MRKKLVTIATFNLPVYAHLSKAKLESEGIECFLRDEHAAALDWSHSAVVGGVKLEVRKADVQKAMKILREVDLGNNSISEDVGADKSGESGRFDSWDEYKKKSVRRIAFRKRVIFIIVLVVFLIWLGIMLRLSSGA